MLVTHHAKNRLQQRGIPPLVIDLLLMYGRRTHDHRGAELIHFDKEAKKKVASYTGGLVGKLNEHLDSYAVVRNGALITAGHKYIKFKNK